MTGIFQQTGRLQISGLGWMLVCWLAPAAAFAQPASSMPSGGDEATHAELRALRDQLVQALTSGDMNKAIACCHPDVVITWQNAEVGRGHAGIKNFIDKMMTGPAPIVKSYKTEASVDELTKLYGGDTGIAVGDSTDRFVLSNGTELALKDRWTASVVKQDGKWMIAALHVSTNAFDNPILNRAASLSYWVGGGGALLGLLIGIVAGRRWASSRS